MTGLNVRPAMEKAGLAKGASTAGAVTVLDGSSFALQVASRFSVPLPQTRTRESRDSTFCSPNYSKRKHFEKKRERL
jgi:hypothetical protein